MYVLSKTTISSTIQSLQKAHALHPFRIFVSISHHFKIYSRGPKDTCCTNIPSTAYRIVPNKQPQFAIYGKEVSQGRLLQGFWGRHAT